MNTFDNIVAPATGTGGAITILRISGPEALEIGNRIWSGKTPLEPASARMMKLGRVGVDSALAVCMPGPGSYTGDDVVELHCHGGAAVAEQALKLALDAGCRMAEPGEFTFRAFVNGKLDLTQAEAVADCADAEVGFYHVGGVRLDRVEKGAVSSATVYGLEPFGTHVAAMRMTPAQMRRMIVEKYNDTVNLKEAHRIDLIATTPYDIVVDAEDRAVDVRFPALREGRLYRVGMNDYIFRNYRGLEYSEGRIEDDQVAEVLLEELGEESPLRPDNRPRQRIVRP